MKDKILNSGLLRFLTGLKICRWAAAHPLLGKFCSYEVISYLICGVLTTALDYIVHFVCRGLGLSTGLSLTIAWISAVIFAYFVNKIFVFLSTDWSAGTLAHELTGFVSCRIASYFMNLAIMLVTVDVLHWNEPLMKLLSGILVMIVNYFGSKLLVFGRRKGEIES